MFNAGGNNGYDMFLSQFDINGNFLWATLAGNNNLGAGDNISTGIDVDDLGNIYISGYFNGSSTFNSNNSANVITVNAAINGITSWDGYVTRYSSNGTVQWVQTISSQLNLNGSPDNDFLDGIDVDCNGNCYLVGYHYFDAICSSQNMNTGTILGEGLMVAKYDNLGNLQWVSNAGASSANGRMLDFSGISLDGNGNSYLVSSFIGKITIGNSVGAQHIATSNGNNDIVISTFDDSGNLIPLSVTQFGGTNDDNGRNIVVDAQRGNTFITGDFYGSLPIATQTIVSHGANDILLASCVGLPPTNPISAGNDVTICNSSSTTLTASGGGGFSWSPASGLNTTMGAVVVANPSVTTIYSVTGVAPNGCTYHDEVTVTVAGTCDFSIVKTSNYTSTYAGQPIKYTITVCNNTGSPQNITLTDNLPSNFIIISSPSNFPGFPGSSTFSIATGCTDFIYWGYFVANGLCPIYTNIVNLQAGGQTYTADVCVNIRYGCPMIVYGNSDCIQGNDVNITLGVHTQILKVNKVEDYIVYPEFISPPPAGSLSGYVNGPTQLNQVASTIGTPVTHIYQDPTTLVWYNKVLITLIYSPVLDVSPPYAFGSIKFNYTNTPTPRPTGIGSFLCWTIAPVSGPYHSDVYIQGQSLPLDPWTQAYHVSFSGCPDVPQIDASFSLNQPPCDIDGIVFVNANYVSPTAIHIWDFGDNRATPFNGAQQTEWKYLHTYTDNFPYTWPKSLPGTYIIKHTVIDNGAISFETKTVVISPPCCSMPTSIVDRTYASSIGSSLNGAQVEIQGKFYIDQNFTFDHCAVTMDPGAEIIIQSGAVLYSDGSEFSACNNMWKGITVMDNAAFSVFNNSFIADAQYAIYLQDKSTAKVSETVFERNFVSIYCPQSAFDFNNIGLSVRACTFQSGSGLAGPFTGQIPSPHIKSFAGIQLNDMTLDLINSGSNPNYFNDMSNGIVGNRLELNATNCVFTNIYPDVNYKSIIPFNGSAIYDVGGHGYFGIKQVGFGKNASQSTFDNCYYGITGQQINLYSASNKMTNMSMGYRIQYSNYMNIDIINNYIDSKFNGIDLRMNDNAEHVLIQSNDIHFGTPSLMSPKLNTAINVYELNGKNPNSKINSNSIYYKAMANNAMYGIQLYSSKDWQVTNNNLFMYNNSYNGFGIVSTGCQHPIIGCNQIYGSNSNYIDKYQSGIKNIMGSNPEISCNITDGTYNGIYFSGPAYGTDLKGNNIHNHVNGLHLDNTAIIGIQDFKGNLWYQPSVNSGLNAIYDNVFNALIYRFKAEPLSTIPSASTFPFSFSPSGWFNSQSGSNFECLQNGTSYCSHFRGDHNDIDLIDYLIASGNLQNNPYTDETKWILKGDLYEKLKDSLDFLTGDSTMMSFYNRIQDQVFAQFKDISEDNSALFDLDVAVRNNLNQNKQLLEQQMDQLKVKTEQLLNGSLNSVQIDATRLDIITLQHRIDSLISYNKNVLNLATNTRLLSAENTKLMNDGLVTTTTIEENERTVNKIYLSTIAKGLYSFDDNQTFSLLNISQQCPMLGGNSVFVARAIFAMINDEMQYDDVNSCLQNGIILRQQKSNSTINNLNKAYIMPNPANQNATLIYQLENNSGGIIEFYDILGKVLLKYNLTAESTQRDIDLSTISNGLYYYKVISNEIEIGSGKITVIK